VRNFDILKWANKAAAHSKPAEPIISIRLPIAAIKIIADLDFTSVLFRILEPKLRWDKASLGNQESRAFCLQTEIRWIDLRRLILGIIGV
jgi:hypothetical protein